MKNSEIIKKSKSLLNSNYGKVMFPYFITYFIIGLFANSQDLFIIILNIAEVESEIAFQITGIVSPIIYLIVPLVAVVDVKISKMVGKIKQNSK